MESELVPKKFTLFQQSKDGITYRIPALVYLKSSKSFLAFAEKRSSVSDNDAECLVMRRGHFNGDSVEWEEPINEIKEAQKLGFRTMNPCPVFEEKNGVLFLFFICVKKTVSEFRQIFTGTNAARLCYVCSKDEGAMWSNLTDLTKSVIGDKTQNWATFAVGPGHGIQLQSGRLIIPAYMYYIHVRWRKFQLPCFTKPHSFNFYSDDYGKNWKIGDIIARSKTVECEMAEILCQNDKCVLYCNARTPHHCRVEAVSNNCGSEFEKAHLASKLVEPPHGCQGSVVSFVVSEDYHEERCPATKKEHFDLMASGGRSWLLFSHPVSKNKRADLGVYLNKSPLDFSGWEYPWIINHGPSGYSDLAVCREGRLFGCLFECGGVHACQEIAFTIFPLESVMQGKKMVVSSKSKKQGNTCHVHALVVGTLFFILFFIFFFTE
ncbi:sialidase-3-like [Protopterus annectens]|uniref:sialidase-3-like n=1 Tax=Protopterus annectens TaxID=7888 RepID=UPI001CF9ADCC|nr:sialidase-3-like [Protopterus annectens]